MAYLEACVSNQVNLDNVFWLWGVFGWKVIVTHRVPSIRCEQGTSHTCWFGNLISSLIHKMKVYSTPYMIPAYLVTSITEYCPSHHTICRKPNHAS